MTSRYPIHGVNSVQAWDRLNRSKPFFLKAGDAMWFVDSGGNAVPQGPDGRFVGVPVRARTLLNQDMEPGPRRPGRGSRK